MQFKINLVPLLYVKDHLKNSNGSTLLEKISQGDGHGLDYGKSSDSF